MSKYTYNLFQRNGDKIAQHRTLMPTESHLPREALDSISGLKRITKTFM